MEKFCSEKEEHSRNWTIILWVACALSRVHHWGMGKGKTPKTLNPVQ
jgi:hypothetical protein